MKQISGGDPLTGRNAYGDQETFTPPGTIWLSLNSQPHLEYDDEAMWRRVRVIPFGRSFTGKDRDNDLEAKLKLEDSGILKWLLEGAFEYARIGLGSCVTVDQATRQLRDSSDTILVWLQTVCVESKGALLPAQVAYDSYKAFTRDAKRKELSMAKFKAEMEKTSYSHVRRSHGNCYRDLELRDGG